MGDNNKKQRGNKMNDRFKFRVIRGENPFTPTGTVLHFALGDEVGFGQGDIIEQCTGLKDKNGNLIYEGDIIKDRGGITYKIQWKDACFFAVAIDNFNYMPDSMLVQTWLNTWKAEIIGNVHEQAEQKK